MHYFQLRLARMHWSQLLFELVQMHLRLLCKAGFQLYLLNQSQLMIKLLHASFGLRYI